MKKKFLTVAGAAILALSMSIAAIADDAVTADKDYGTEGQATDSSTAWGSGVNGQFAIEDGQTVTFTFDSKSADTTNAVFGWVAEVTDKTSYFTVTQGGTAWFAPPASPWGANTNNVFQVEKSWEDADASTYAAAMSDAKVELVVTRAGEQIVLIQKLQDLMV